MTRIEFAPRARADLDDIERYLLREAGGPRAKAVLKRVRDRVGSLAQFPRIETEREDYGGRRIMSVPPYVVIYRVREEGSGALVIILRIVHGARDIPTLLAGK